MTTQRVKGHIIIGEGAPQKKDGDRLVTINWGRTSGPGLGACTCGAHSDVLPSASQRKAWHRAHKDDVIEGRWKP